MSSSPLDLGLSIRLFLEIGSWIYFMFSLTGVSLYNKDLIIIVSAYELIHTPTGARAYDQSYLKQSLRSAGPMTDCL